MLGEWGRRGSFAVMVRGGRTDGLRGYGELDGELGYRSAYIRWGWLFVRVLCVGGWGYRGMGGCCISGLGVLGYDRFTTDRWGTMIGVVTAMTNMLWQARRANKIRARIEARIKSWAKS